MQAYQRWVARANTVLLACALTGCLGVTGVRRGIAKRTWYELRSEHFVLVTDLPRQRAEARVRNLEQLWQALADMYVLVVPDRAPPRARMRSILFRDCDDFRDVLWLEGVVGYVERSRDFESKPTVVTCEGMPTRTRILLHELAHAFNYHFFSDTPAWLNEGLATYFQTLEIEDGKAILGRLPWHDVGFWLRPKWLPSLERLLSLDYDQFYAGKRRRNYFAAWKLVHLLNNYSDDYHARFQRFLAAVASGVDRMEAWRQAFDGIPFEKLSKQYADYQYRQQIRLYTTPYELRESSRPIRARELRVGEVHALWAELQIVRAFNAKRSHPDLRAARIHVGLAAKQDPSWNGALFWRGVVDFWSAVATDKSTGAVGELRRYVAAEPGSARGWLGLVSARLNEVVPKGHTGLEARAPAGLEALEDDVRELARHASTFAELNLVAYYFALRRQPATGFNFARRALEQDPRCAGCLDTLALLLYQLGRYKEALALQERAIAVMAEIRPSAEARERLEHYRTCVARNTCGATR